MYECIHVRRYVFVYVRSYEQENISMYISMCVNMFVYMN